MLKVAVAAAEYIFQLFRRTNHNYRVPTGIILYSFNEDVAYEVGLALLVVLRYCQLEDIDINTGRTKCHVLIPGYTSYSWQLGPKVGIDGLEQKQILTLITNNTLEQAKRTRIVNGAAEHVRETPMGTPLCTLGQVLLLEEFKQEQVALVKKELRALYLFQIRMLVRYIVKENQEEDINLHSWSDLNWEARIAI